MRTEQAERVRMAESRPCRDGDVYLLKLRPIPPERQGWRGRLAYIEHLMVEGDNVSALAEVRSMIDGDWKPAA